MRFALLFVAVAAIAPAWASEPGQPLDCSDWVFLEPGLSCTVYAPRGALTTSSPFLAKGSNKATDNNGRFLLVKYPLACNDALQGFVRTELVRFDGATEQTIGYIEDRQGIPGAEDRIRPRNSELLGICNGAYATDLGENISFDAINGRLLIPLESLCTRGADIAACTHYRGEWWIASIEGFASTFEILQTYTPIPSTIGFRVPYMPEGFPAADYFDTYYGDLATVGDWSQAQALRCGYPSTPPSVGDYLTVADTLSDPAPGTGRYYVTAVHHQGEVRFGRKSSGGVLSGRDPATLPACLQ